MWDWGKAKTKTKNKKKQNSPFYIRAREKQIKHHNWDKNEFLTKMKDARLRGN